MAHTSFRDAFSDGAKFRDAQNETVVVAVREIGKLRLWSGGVTVGDPLTTDFGDPAQPLDRRVPGGEFPVEIAVAHFANGDQRIACARVRFSVGAVAARWAKAKFEGQRDPEDGETAGYGVDAGMGCFVDAAAHGQVDEATTEAWLSAMNANGVNTWTWHEAPIGDGNAIMFSSGWGDGFYGSFWGFDDDENLVELVTDFEVLLRSVGQRFDVPLSPPRGRLEDPLLTAHDVTARTPLLSRKTIILGGKGSARVELSDGSPVEMARKALERHYSWKHATPGAHAVIHVMTGVEPLERIQ